METSTRFLPKFELSDDLARSLYGIEKAKALSIGWYKGQFDYHLRKAGYVIMINGEEYYAPVSGLRILQSDFFTEGTSGYHVAQFLKLIGLEDTDLIEIQKIAGSDGVDGVYHSWKAKEGMSNSQFRRNLQNLKQDLLDVDTIEIDYENQRYKKSVYTTEASRVYNAKESLYGDSLQWSQQQDNFIQLKWTDDNRIMNFDNIQTRTVRSGFGNAIRFFKLGVDVTSQYNDKIKFAVQSMIAYSGNEFMQRISSIKKSESDEMVQRWNIYGNEDLELYTKVTGTETFDATIKQAFLDDIENRHFIRYTGIYHPDSGDGSGAVAWWEEKREELDGRSPLTLGVEGYGMPIILYPNTFWQYVGYVNASNSSTYQKQKIVNNGDEFLFLDSGNYDIGAYMKISEFRKLPMEQMSYYIGEYFDIRVTTKSGGFFEGFIGTLSGLLGKVFDLAFDIFMLTPVMRYQLQIFTSIINQTFGSSMTEKEVFSLGIQVAWTIVGFLLAPVTGGISVAIISAALSLGIAGSDLEEAKKEAEGKSERERYEQKTRAEKKEEEAEKEKRKQRLKMKLADEEREEFQMFLRNPLYREDAEKQRIDSEYNLQFKLI